jgi:Ca-activated chloride channel family protein
MRFAAFMIGLGISGALASAAPQEAGRALMSVETDLVTLSVTVVDRHGAVVPDLRREQFTIYDNGERRPIEFFMSEELPATVGLVIDGSRSMRGRRDDIIAAGTSFAASSHPLDELFTVYFNETTWLGLPPRVQFAEDAEQLRTALARAPAAGMTALYDAVSRALDHVQLGTHDRRALVIVSDGGDNASARTLDEVTEQARKADVVMYAVILVDPDGQDAKPGVLKKLARETGGAALAPKRAEELTKAFIQIAREIRSGYMLGFSPPDRAASGYRTLRVEIDAKDHRPLVARTRAGYYAGQSGSRIR